MPLFFFVSDLHGDGRRYRTLAARIVEERPAAVLLGGDLLPHGAFRAGGPGFVTARLAPLFQELRSALGPDYPDVMAILGNDDGRRAEAEMVAGEREGLWRYLHARTVPAGAFTVSGYACVPPTPFALKDWERYDVSRYVDPGCVSPEEGVRTVPVDPGSVRFGTIASDLQTLLDGVDMERSILLFHTPPYRTALDRAALDGRSVDGVPVDVHVGSIAVRRCIEARRPVVGLHGHVHESARITGSWRDTLGTTVLLSAAHDGPELSLVRFDPKRPAAATRELVPAD